MKIIEVKENKKQYLDLLLLADEQEDMVDRYLDNGKMYVLDDNGVKCECVITDKENDILEIKNIATVPEYQGKGYARALIEFIVNNYREQYAMGRDLLCVFDDEKTVRNLQLDMNKLLNLDGLRMCTRIFWMMTEGKMQSFLKKHFMRKRIWIHRCMYNRKIIMQLLLMKSIRNFWQKYWQIQRCGRCSIRWQRR